MNDENSKTGNSTHTWKYFEVFSQVYGSKASTKVAVSFDTGRKEKLTISDDDKSPHSDRTTSTSGTSASVKKAAVKVSKKHKISDTTNFMQNLQEQNQNLMSSIERHHEEKMRRIDRMLDIMERSMDKK